MPEYVALDLETTGLDPARDRVIEVGAVAFTPDRTLATLERLVDPQRPLPDAISRLTGITQADLKGAATAESAVAELINFIGGRQPVGHGARLDLEFLTTSGLWNAESDILDTLDVARKHRLSPARISQLRREFLEGWNEFCGCADEQTSTRC